MKPKATAKKLALTVASAIGLHRLARPWLGGIGVIFTSHRVIGPGEVVLDPSQAITTLFLSQCLDHVVRRGYEIISLQQLQERVSACRHGAPFVCFTFDDGYRDNLIRALPIFKRHNAPLNIYVTTGLPDRRLFYWWRAIEKIALQHDRIDVKTERGMEPLHTRTLAEKRAVYSKLCKDFGNSQRESAARALFAQYGVDPELLLDEDTLSWPELTTLAGERLVTLGAHSVSHPALSELDSRSAMAEMAGSKARLEEALRVPIEHFAYPFGDSTACGDREYALARKVGFKTATTTRACNLFHEHAHHLWSLPRLSLDSTMERLTDLDLHLSGLTAAAAMRLRHPAFSGRYT